MLRVSLSTVARRIREHGLVKLLPYSTISEEDLDGIVRDVQALFPNIGYRRMLGNNACTVLSETMSHDYHVFTRKFS